MTEVRNVSGVDRVARSTLSDAMAKFDPQSLAPLMAAIRSQLPRIERFDPQTAHLTRQITAADGSWFNLAGAGRPCTAMRPGQQGQPMPRASESAVGRRQLLPDRV